MAIKSQPDLNAMVDEMSAQDIKSLIDYAQSKLQEKRESAKQALIDEIKSKASQLGLSFEDLVQTTSPEPKPNKKRSTVSIKYRGPGEHDIWTGRGRVPRWLKALMDAGHNKDEFAI